MRIIKEDKNNKNFFMIEITDDQYKLKEILYKLYELDVIGSNLFPDLQGFSESLGIYLAFPKILKPQHEELKKLYK